MILKSFCGNSFLLPFAFLVVVAINFNSLLLAQV